MTFLQIQPSNNTMDVNTNLVESKSNLNSLETL